MTNRAKQRGQRRKLERLLLNIEEIVPYSDTSDIYEHFHVPSNPFISSPKTSGKVKTEFCRGWLKKTAEIIEHKPTDLSFCKVIAMIDTDDMWRSQIIIFYDKEYYECFWNRDTSWQKWMPIESRDMSFVKERNIKTVLSEKGYLETISDDDESRNTVLWFYGDVQ